MNAKQKPVNIGRDTVIGNPFHDGLTILARIISRAYRRDLLISRLYIPSYGAQTYIEWPLICVDGVPILVPTTCCY
jgi:hypothetical protein